MNIKMLGVGNGFSKEVFDNNALIYSTHDEYAMIDCGTTAWTSLDCLNIPREKIKSIFVTHIHFDHTGGVESAALYGKFVQNRKMRLIVPAPIKERIWDKYLSGAIEDENQNLTSLEDFFEVVSPEEGELFELVEGIQARWIHVKHLADKFSCGLIINDKFLYTSDMISDLEFLEKHIEQGVEVIFHDAHFKKVINHAHYEELLAYPEAIKKKLYLMHHGLKDEVGAPNDDINFLYQHREYTFK